MPPSSPVLFYGVPHGCSFGAIAALEALGEPFRLGRIDMGHAPPAFARIHPYNYTPALLRPDGVPLIESGAILASIIDRDPSAPKPGSLARDRLNEAVAWLHTALHGGFGWAWTAYRLADDDPAKTILREQARIKAGKAFALIERWLRERDWIAGEARTVADGYFFGVARWGAILNLFDLAKEYPRVHRHFERLKADKAIEFAQAIEEQQPAASSGGFQGHVEIEQAVAQIAA